MKLLLFASLLLASFASAQIIDPKLATPGDKGFVIAGLTDVASVTVGTAGTGYTTVPTVAFTGGSGTVQATGTATLKVVGSVTVTAGGTGYTVGDVLTLVGGTKTTSATFTVATVTSGAVATVTITNEGVYSVVPAAPTGVTGGTGTGATLTPGYGVGTVALTTTGAGYTTAPSVAFTGGGGTSAAATAVLDTFAITAPFRSIVPLTDSVIASITFAPRARAGRPAYAGDAGIIGKTLKAGVEYTVYGDVITLTSGTAFLNLR